ncbi:ribonuclease domain-containing protein [Vulcaniibacterium tengchongense]|uniref:Guanyl-specific ribonuclease Sa n=1 Tax=Vulcaniibacterium tengchongense TaxID=1273429 RepID=A0A3N4W292_9GAMM|nr:ribonuclease domain-containing protein [Vulcaniibacterium tengchongense]RPE80190.1 guanyl-specific ribonuclease Sa [Vulcaniibacterium tengchongense]
MRRTLPWLLAAIALLGLGLWLQRPGGDAGSEPAARAPARSDAAPRESLPGFLPPEAAPVLARIVAGGPHPYRQDGSVFQNRERRLPPRPRGWYREYTVPTPGERDRGARRIVAGGDPPSEFWYTADHYRSFRRFDFHAAEAR